MFVKNSVATCKYTAGGTIIMAGQASFHTLLLLLCYSVAISENKSISYQFPEQWQAWKTAHSKNYTSQIEELDRHLVWLSNKKYIESHNAYSHVFGYTLELNKFADWVREGICRILINLLI